MENVSTSVTNGTIFTLVNQRNRLKEVLSSKLDEMESLRDFAEMERLCLSSSAMSNEIGDGNGSEKENKRDYYSEKLGKMSLLADVYGVDTKVAKRVEADRAYKMKLMDRAAVIENVLNNKPIL